MSRQEVGYKLRLGCSESQGECPGHVNYLTGRTNMTWLLIGCGG